MSSDVYTNRPEERYPGARERTRPGAAHGEQAYDSVLDSHGKRVSGKPANRAILADQRARAARARKRAERERERSQSSPGRSTSILAKLVLAALFIPALSHFLTGTYHFGLEDTVRPVARRLWRHPANPFADPGREFTLAQLSQYDGADDSRPVYLSVAGTVYDVSANRRIYGRGGSYNMMAGRDASRAFVTGCFQTHLTHDVRGLSEAELKALNGWKEFFDNHPRYFPVGRTLLPPIDPNTPIPAPCRDAAGNAPGAQAARHGGAKPGPVVATGK